MTVKKKKSANISSIIITVLAVLLAVAAVIFLIVTFFGKNGKDPDSTRPDDSFIPTSELVSSAEQAAYDLLPKNYKIYQYFTKGMTTKEEPYGNKPEDGFYTCVNEDYKNFDEFCDFIRSVFTEMTAATLITDPFGNGPIYGNDNGELGLSAKFVPTKEDGLSWENVKFTCTLLSETECMIDITLKDSSGNDVKKEVKMVIEDENWRLTELVG